MPNFLKINLDVYEMPETPLAPAVVVTNALNIAGGALMIIGSFSPWVYVRAADFIFFLNGYELGTNRGFSIAGVIPALIGAIAIFTSAMKLAKRCLPRPFDFSVYLNAIAGIGVGIYGLSWANWYHGQLTGSNPGLFASGIKYGVWFILIGGGFAAVGSAFHVVGGRRIASRHLEEDLVAN